jgi:hypothetical protein
MSDPQLLALMQVLTRFVNLARGGHSRTRDVQHRAAGALGVTSDTQPSQPNYV